MTKTQYYTACTVDGFIADPDNSLSWLFEVAEGDNQFGSFFPGIGAFAMGATTYEWVYRHEELGEHPERWRAWYGSVPAWVFTHRELPRIDGADVRFVQGDVAPVHAEMVGAADGKDIWLVGGGELVGRFADANLLDELILGVAPATLGAGAPLLPRRLTGGRLRLTAVRQVGQFAYLTYAVRPG